PDADQRQGARGRGRAGRDQLRSRRRAPVRPLERAADRHRLALGEIEHRARPAGRRRRSDTGGEMSEQPRAGLIGLGTMGAPMARQILAKHGALTVYDTDAGALDALARAGARPAGSPREVGEQADAVITMLPHPD